MKNSEIAGLIKECLNGNKESYGSIVHFFHEKIYFLCLQFLETAQDAEDAAIEVFIKAYNSLGNFKPQYAFSTWLSRIAVNHSLDILRRQKREKEYILVETSNPTSLTELKSPDRVFFEQAQQQGVENALKLLPIKHRTVLMLKYHQNLSYKEISEIMEIPVNTAASLILRGKKELREKISTFQQEAIK